MRKTDIFTKFLIFKGHINFHKNHSSGTKINLDLTSSVTHDTSLKTKYQFICLREKKNNCGKLIFSQNLIFSKGYIFHKNQSSGTELKLDL